MRDRLYFPMFIDLNDKKVVVVGGGRIATRRVKTLIQFSHEVYVVAPLITDDIDYLYLTGKINLERRPVQYQDFDGAYMVIAATDDGRLNDDIANYCNRQGIYVNVASDKAKCDFHFPGVIRREEVVIGVNASGVDHKLAKKVRMELEEFFGMKDKASAKKGKRKETSENDRRKMDDRKQGK